MKTADISFNEYLKKEEIDILEVIKDESPDAIQEMLVLLSNEGELSPKEIETFSYVFDVIEEEFKQIDRSLPSAVQEQNMKDLFNKNKLDIFMKAYSKIMGANSALYISLASAGAIGSGMASFAIAGPIIVASHMSLTKYSEYTKNKKYNEESLVRDWLKIKDEIEGDKDSSTYHKRVDSFNKKIAYFKSTSKSRIGELSEKGEKKTLLQNVKSGLKFISAKGIDLLLYERGDRKYKTNDHIRQAEQMIYDTWGTTDDIEEVFKEASMKLYNEHLSRNMEEYASYLAKERFLLYQEIKQQEEKIQNEKLSNPRGLGREIIELRCRVAVNTQQLEKISNLEGMNRTKNREEAVYFAGVSRLVNELLTNDKTLSETYNSRERCSAETFLSFSGSRYEELLLLEKKKALLRIKKENLEKEIGIKINKDSDQKDIIMYSKMLSVIISKDNPEDAKERMLEVLGKHKKQGTEDYFFLKNKYNEFIDDFFHSLSSYSKPLENDPSKLDKNFKDKVREIIIRETNEDPYCNNKKPIRNN